MGRNSQPPLSFRRPQALTLLCFAWAMPALAQQEPPESGGSSTPGPVTAKSGTTGTPDSAVAGKSSKQVKISCDDPKVRLAFSSFADTVDRNFRQLIRDSSDWVYPILITVKGSLSDIEADPLPSTVNRIDLLPDGQFSLQIGIRLSSSFKREEAVRELLRVLMFERMLRPFQSNPDAIANKEIDAPPWLLTGVDQLIVHNKNGRPSEFYAGIVRARQVLSVGEILNEEPDRLDSLSEAVFKASASALIAALLDQPQGHRHFQEFLSDLAGASKGDMEARIRQHFPGLRGSAGALEKWWSLQIAHMGQKQTFEFLSVEQTEVLLGEALKVRFGVEPRADSKGIGKWLPKLRPGQPFDGQIHDFEKFIGRSDAARVLEQNQVKLRSLSMRAFPLYRNVVTRYEAVVLLLLRDQKRGLRTELKAIDQARTGVAETMSRVNDYMNYYEATQGEGKSEAFENYRETRKKIEMRRRRRPDRKDRISKYLDALQAEFEEEGRP